MNTARSECEDRRCQYLHALCIQIERRVADGMTIKDAVRLAARRRNARLFKRGALAPKTLANLFRAWRRNRVPDVFRRRWKPGRPRVPVALLIEFLDRLTAGGVPSATTVVQTLRSDWRLGRSIPGLGTWKEYVRRQRGESAARTTPPRFPVSYRSFMRALAGSRTGEFQRRAIAARRAQRALNLLTNFIEARRSALEARRTHEPLGTPFGQQR